MFLYFVGMIVGILCGYVVGYKLGYLDGMRRAKRIMDGMKHE